ncbi:hypothetical protein NECAME_19016 [Necator americanus]|uniref:Uncharacterized protein n=1 Tax=Necator americanus TaxID=51031 RepID=W2SR64_NECAM|nr:hypothetical protein NECAME_19016 [Necator americanus]ETN72125.1 hypothetical protein NECAME_19016 [Necator americanus]
MALHCGRRSPAKGKKHPIGRMSPTTRSKKPLSESLHQNQSDAPSGVGSFSRRGCVGGLLRRRSTSDRHVVLGFRNEGFRLTNDVTPQAAKRSSKN